MSFYITAPGGNISLHKLSQFAETRFKFLAKVYDTGGDRLQIFDIVQDEKHVYNSDCLIEGTVKDRLSHFILRLASCCDREMSAFLVKAETLLFDFRFNCMIEEELCKLFKSVDYHRYTSTSQDLPVFITQFHKTMSMIKGDCSKWRMVVRKYLNGDIDCFTVPFWTVLHLVATRQVVLNHGLANVPVYKLREIVTSLFEELLQKGIQQAAEVFKTDDQRIKILIKTIKVMFYENYKDKYAGRQYNYDLSHIEVDRVIEMFPPCMSHLHTSLRTTHRLKHHSRIQYSLFLKEIGLSIHEALMFWRKEYMQSPNIKEGCLHMWSKDEGRYTYNIRHLYGLEGSKINYRGHSCVALQENYHGPHESSGCPFIHFDTAHLLELLHMYGISSLATEEILKLSIEKQYSQACALYFMMKIKEKEYENRLSEINHTNYYDSSEHPGTVNDLDSTLEHKNPDRQDNINAKTDCLGICCSSNTECSTDISSCGPLVELQCSQKNTNIACLSLCGANSDDNSCRQESRRNLNIISKPAEYYYKFKLIVDNKVNH